MLGDAAASLADRAPAVAQELLERALASLPESDPAHERLARERALALLRAGRQSEGEAACRENRPSHAA